MTIPSRLSSSLKIPDSRHENALAHLRPLDTERQDLRESWRRRLPKNARLDPAVVSAPVARAELVKARHGQTVWWRLDQTAVGDRMALLMVA